MSVVVAPQQPVAQRTRAPLYLLIPATLVAVAMLIPLFYLFLRAFQAEPAQLADILWRQRNLDLLWNTLKLTGGVLILTTLMALPTAWLVTRTDIRFKKLITLLAVIPLAVPGYVMAYALMGLGGYYGVFAQLFGWQLPRISGYWGALMALSFYTFSYLFLNLRAALLGLDPNLEESAQSLGYGPWATFRHVLLPHLLPALMAGWLVIGLYVMGDFGAVALMRYEAFSYAIFNQYENSFDRFYAAWLSLMLLALAASFVMMETLIKRKRLASLGSSAPRQQRQSRLGWLHLPAWLYLSAVFLSSIGLPVMILAYWLILAPPDLSFFLQVPATFLRSATVAIPAALLTSLMAIPVAYLLVRYPSRWSSLIERSTYIGYALPPITLALAMVYFALNTAYFLYQTLAMLVFALALATLALAMGPIRSHLLQTRVNLEEAAFSLGYSPLATFYHVIFPRLRRSLLASATLVFLFCMKELPITMLLSPTNYTTLAVTVYTRTSEGMMAEAAPFAAAILLFSTLSVGLVLNREKA
ncbi:iron ABC transporter permease [Marinospirillum sp. MEB164]|uniref:Iron ABC transporter permease n=1 Tax=Marinospirillum alkalitolerans TaxID=3123374 RepID=A0ABW8PWI0_9GAMM